MSGRTKAARSGRPVRSFDVGQRQDLFLIAAVTTVLVIRLQLWATNYPSLSPGKLHIAHLLWGGVFMTAAIWILASYIGRKRVPLAVILGGIGFGFFIDEVGKFVTADNNYFFKPTAAIIYVVFIVLYLTSRWIGHRRFGERGRIANAAELASERYVDGMNPLERQTAIELLEPIKGNAQAGELLAAIRSSPVGPPDEYGRLVRLVLWMQRTYDDWVRTGWFQVLMIGAVVVGILITAFGIIDLIFLSGNPGSAASPGYATDGISNLKLVNAIPLASSSVASLIALVGIVPLLRGERIKAYRRFRMGLMIAVFVTYPFIFAENSFSAVSGLLLTLAALGTISAMLHQEEQEKSAAGAPAG